VAEIEEAKKEFMKELEEARGEEMPAGEKSVEEGYSSLEIAAESGAEETASPDLDAATSQNEE